MSLVSARWVFDIRALSSIVHGEDAGTQVSNQSMFRREKILRPDGAVSVVPIVSGNSFRGILRRIGEELLAETLGYAGELSTAAAYLMRSGGTLRKSSKVWTPEQERDLKTLVPLIGLFGGTVNGRILSGCSTVSKVVPLCEQTRHLIPPSFGNIELPTQFSILGLEQFGHHADVTADAQAVDFGDPLHPQARFELECLIAGTRLYATATLTYATELQFAFFESIVAEFCASGHLGGHAASGHGAISADADLTITSGNRIERVDWRTIVHQRRTGALALLARVD